VLVLTLGTCLATVRGQGPAIDTGSPPGVPGGGSKLGQPVGALGGLDTEIPLSPDSSQPITSRLGAGMRASQSSVNPPRTSSENQVKPFARRLAPEAAEAVTVPSYGQLDLPERAGGETGPPDGLTLDQAIERLLGANLSLLALRYEIPQSRADILTASLRANPVFYGDSQLIPYGRYSRANPGGQTQYDVNVTYPIDVSRKRIARTRVAVQAERVVEAQFQDAVRLQIDNLYTFYVNVVAAEETLRYSQRFAEGISRLYDLRLRLFEQGQIGSDQVNALRAQKELAEFQVRETTSALKHTTAVLATLLNIPRDRAADLKLRAALRDVEPLPQSTEDLVQLALKQRPDLVAYRLGVTRADLEIRLAKANAFQDVQLLYQPYTLQDNRPFGLKSPTSWAVGVTVPLPIYNRNQGNVERAKLNADQTRIEMAALERQLTSDVEEAIREFNISRDAVIEMESDVLPASQKVRDTIYQRFVGGQASILDYLEAQRAFNEVVRQYRDVLVRHRNAMLDVNTAVGSRVVP
jgi:cobalt-zinc-cadmium efflux system outer membrane protein